MKRWIFMPAFLAALSLALTMAGGAWAQESVEPTTPASPPATEEAGPVVETATRPEPPPLAGGRGRI